MFETLLEELKFMDEGAIQGMVFALGFLVYYAVSKLLGGKKDKEEHERLERRRNKR